MSRRTRRSRGNGGRAGLDWLVLPLFPITPFMSFLIYHSVPVSESWALMALLALVAMGWLFVGFARLHAEILRPVVYAMALLVFIDLEFRLNSRNALSKVMIAVGDFSQSSFLAELAVLLLIVAAFLAACTLTWLLRRHLAVISLTVLSVMASSTLVLSQATVEWGVTKDQPRDGTNDAPPVVHLVLDEMAGISGIPSDIPGGAELRRDIRSFFVRRGFRLYERAYSEYLQTQDSIPSLVRGLRTHASLGNLDTSGPRPTVRENTWFDRLARQGYAIRVYEGESISLCRNEGVVFCFVYPDNSIAALRLAEIDAISKARVALGAYFSGAYVGRLFNQGRRRLAAMARDRGWTEIHPIGMVEPFLGPIAAAGLLDRIADDLVSSGPGTAVFAHIALPHAAYVFDAQCLIRPDVSTWYNYSEGLTDNSPFGRRVRYQLYFNQVRCTLAKLDRFLRRLEKAGLMAGSTIIIHGDHGSRISLNRPRIETLGQFSADDAADAYMTLLAVRRPGLPAGSYQKAVSLHQYFQTEFLGISENIEPGIYISPFPFRKGMEYVRIPPPWPVLEAPD